MPIHRQHNRRSDRYVKTLRDGQTAPTTNQATAARRMHRSRARARAPGPALAAAAGTSNLHDLHCAGRLGPDVLHRSRRDRSASRQARDDPAGQCGLESYIRAVTVAAVSSCPVLGFTSGSGSSGGGSSAKCVVPNVKGKWLASAESAITKAHARLATSRRPSPVTSRRARSYRSALRPQHMVGPMPSRESRRRAHSF